MAAALGARCQRDVAIGPRTTYRVGGRAALFLDATAIDDLRGLAPVLAATGVPVLVLGRGSNVLVSDAGFPGLVITLASEPFGTVSMAPGGNDRPGGGGGGEEAYRVRAGGAVPLPVLARQTAAAGLTGLEWAVGVPGSVGGAVRMNAGGHGADTGATLRHCRLVDLTTGRAETFSVGDLALGYRCSSVTATQVVVEAEYQLGPGDRAESEATIREIARWRREHQPGGQNAGSVFVNPLGEPPGNSAGWLVDAAGLKGHRHGSAAVSTKHANFILADPDGRADDVVALMLEVQELVNQRLGVELRAEVRLLGFPEHLLSRLGSGGERSPGEAS
ncbi:MAG: FAD-binding protein [Actinomycetota bacterium]|nr:FAD-binding protein [Actinomycetota bacterium]